MGQLDGIKDYRFGQNIKRTPEEERKLKQKGAAASHVARKRNKTMQQCAKLLLSAEPDDNAKALTYKTLHEICMNYRDIDVKRDIYEFMKLRAAATKMDCSKVFSVDDMRWRVICDTEIRFRHDLAMDSRRTEALREYIEDVAFSIFPIREEAVVRM